MRTQKHTSKDLSNMTVNEEAAVYNSLNESDIFSIIQRIKKGIKFPVFKLLMEKSPFTTTEWLGFLHLSERTMLRYKNENKSFDPIYSEKIIEITLLYNYGVSVFGSEENFNTWLQTSNVALGGVAPKKFLDNSLGIHLLKDALTRIAHGVLA